MGETDVDLETALREKKRHLHVDCQRHDLSIIIESMRNHIETKAQWTFFDFGFKIGTTDELRNRSIPHDDVHSVCSIYVTHWNGCTIATRLESVGQRQGSGLKVYKCSCGFAKIYTKCISPSNVLEKEKRFYQVQNISLGVNQQRCTCQHTPAKRRMRTTMTPRPIPVYVIMNHIKVRDVARQNPLHSIASISEKITQLDIFKILPAEQRPQIGQIRNMVSDLQYVYTNFVQRRFPLRIWCHVSRTVLGLAKANLMGVAVRNATRQNRASLCRAGRFRLLRLMRVDRCLERG